MTSAGTRGAGSATVTCAGVANNACLSQAAPLRVKYTVGYGRVGILAPKNNATMARSRHTLAVTFRLDLVTSSVAAKLASSGAIRFTLSGPGTSPVTAAAGEAYTLSVTENVGTGFVAAPAMGPCREPGSPPLQLSRTPHRSRSELRHEA